VTGVESGPGMPGGDLLDEDRIRLLLSWHHSGFSVHDFVTVPPGDGTYSNVRGKQKARGQA
jgi:hypothetical protein